MKKSMKRRKGLGVVAVLLSGLLLTGCGATSLPESIEQTSLKISASGEVTSYLVEEFDKEYYSIKELANMAAEEATAYNVSHPTEGGSEAVVIKKADTFADGKMARLEMQYLDSEIYADYNNETLFYGTVAEAVSAGYDFNTGVKSVGEDGEVLTGTDIRVNGDRYLLITDAKAQVYCPKKITHISDGAKLNGDGSVDTTQTDAIVYILMK